MNRQRLDQNDLSIWLQKAVYSESKEPNQTECHFCRTKLKLLGYNISLSGNNARSNSFKQNYEWLDSTVLSVHMISAFVTSPSCGNEVKPILASVVGSVLLGVLESGVVDTNTAEFVEVIAIGTESEGPAIGTAADALAETFRLYWVDANCWCSWQRRLCFALCMWLTMALMPNAKIFQAKLTMGFITTTVHRFQQLTEFLFLHPVNLEVTGSCWWRHFCHSTDYCYSKHGNVSNMNLWRKQVIILLFLF